MKRSLALLLALLMLALPACAADPAPAENDTTAVTDAAEVIPETTEPAIPYDKLPSDLDYKGATFRAFTRLKYFYHGEMFIMENMKTGKKWPSLMKIAEDGRHQVVSPLPITEQAIVHGNPVQELANSQHNMLMQQQVAHLTELVERTYRVVEQIKHGQMDDRIGLLEAGKNGLILALSMPEGEERNRQIDSSRQNLLVAQAQIEKTLERRAVEFDPLPQAAAMRFMREFFHSGHLAEKKNDVQEMQEYYDLYLQATKLLAASYAICGNLETAEQTFRLSETTIQAIDFSKVKTIAYQHKALTDMFYNAPIGYIEAEREVCMEEAKRYDYVAIEVSGEKLLEVLGDGKTETIQKTGTEE